MKFRKSEMTVLGEVRKEGLMTGRARGGFLRHTGAHTIDQRLLRFSISVVQSGTSCTYLKSLLIQHKGWGWGGSGEGTLVIIPFTVQLLSYFVLEPLSMAIKEPL